MEALDIGRLIECIQERTFLWDEKNNHYRDRKARDMAWMDIGDEMFDNWSQLSRTDKADKVKLMRNKWKHLKDNFMRCVKAGSNTIYADSLYFLRDNFQQSDFSLTPSKNVSVKNKDQYDGHEANENSSSDSFQNNNGLSNAQPSSSQETSDCSSSDFIKNSNSLRNAPPSSSQGTINSSSSVSIENTNGLRNVLPNLSQETNKKAEASPEQEKAAEFLVSLLRDYRELNEDEKLDFRIMCLQLIRNARKKRNSQNLSPVSSSDPMQITPD